MDQIRRLYSRIDHDLVKAIFDHIRNYLMCAFILAIGIVAFKNQTELFGGTVSAITPGLGIITLAFAMFCLNLVDGIKQISKLKRQKMITVAALVFYVLTSARVIELASDFRID